MLTVIAILLGLILLTLIASQISVQGKGSTVFFVLVILGVVVYMFATGLK
jgi:hypothetical protein